MPTPKQATLFAFIIQMFSKFFAYFILLIVANFFAVDEYGKASFVFSVFLLLIQVIQLGIPKSFTPFYVKNKKPEEIFYFTFTLVLLATIGMFIVSVKYPWIFPLALALPFSYFYSVSNGILQSKHKHHLVQLLGLGTVIFPLILLMLFIDSGKTGIISAYALGFIITSAISIILVRSSLLNLIKNPVFKVPKLFIKQAVPIVIIQIALSFLASADISILGLFSTYENVARYTVIYKISTIITIIPLSISMFLLTRTAELKKKEKRKHTLSKAIRITFSFMLIAIILLISILKPVIKIFFKQYIGIEIFVSFLLVGILFSGITKLIYTYLVGIQKSEKALKPFLISVIINLVLDFILIKKYHLYGIVFATVIAQFIALVLLTRKVKLNLAPVFIIPLILPFTYYLNYFGLLLMPIIIIILFLSKLIYLEDIKTLSNTLFSIVKK